MKKCVRLLEILGSRRLACGASGSCAIAARKLCSTGKGSRRCASGGARCVMRTRKTPRPRNSALGQRRFRFLPHDLRRSARRESFLPSRHWCCRPRFRPLYNEREYWYCELAVLMPDHVHLLVSFPPDKILSRVVGLWKRALTKNHKISWQRNFFDHRLRDERSSQQKSDYVLNNPVRAGLIDDPMKWPLYVDATSLNPPLGQRRLPAEAAIFPAERSLNPPIPCVRPHDAIIWSDACSRAACQD